MAAFVPVFGDQALEARVFAEAITQLRGLYAEGWAREDHPYWRDNVLVRYDNLALEVQAKIVAVQAAQSQYWSTKTLPAPEQLGFFLK